MLLGFVTTVVTVNLFIMVPVGCRIGVMLRHVLRMVPWVTVMDTQDREGFMSGVATKVTAGTSREVW